MMTALQVAAEILVKHLPPSAADLRLLDINGELGTTLSQLRPDILPVGVPGQVSVWSADVRQPASVDAVVALDYVLNEPFLETVRKVLRPGGRLIVVSSVKRDLYRTGESLESAEFVRILVEEVQQNDTDWTLIRGEKPHNVSNTVERIQQVASLDGAPVDWQHYRGRFVHLLVVRTPNLPPWKIDESTHIVWQAAAIGSDSHVLMGFSSLPKAVGFLQPAVLEGKIHDINHVPKFRKEVVASWNLPLLLNPTPEVFDNGEVVLVHVNPADAEAPDE